MIISQNNEEILRNAREARRNFLPWGGTNIPLGGDSEFLGWGGTGLDGGGDKVLMGGGPPPSPPIVDSPELRLKLGPS